MILKILTSNSLIKIFRRNLLLITIISILTLSTAIITIRIIEFNQITIEQKNEYIKENKKTIKNRIKQEIDHINYRKSTKIDKLKDEVKDFAYSANRIAEHLYETYSLSKSPDEIKEIVIESLRPMRFNGGRGYVFILEEKGNNLLYPPDTGLENNNLMELSDPNNKKFIKEMIDIAKVKGEGYLDYNWTKPSIEEKYFEKISFVKYFKPFKWVIGAGEYSDEAEKEIKIETLDWIAEIRYDDDEYVFVINDKGTVLMHDPQRELIGENIIDYEDKNGIKVIQELIKASKKDEGGFVFYSWPKPSIKKELPKISYVQYIKEYNWIIGTGVYIDDIDELYNNNRDRIVKELSIKIILTIIIAFVIIIISSITSNYITKRINKNFSTLYNFFKKASTNYIKIDKDALYYKEFKILSESVNHMIEERETIQKKLEVLNNELESKVKAKTVELEKSNKTLIEKNYELKQAYDELDSFSYSVSHDLRSPLRSIEGFSRAVIEDYEDKLDDTGKNYLERLVNASKRMSSLINDMLKLSRLSRSTMHIERINLSDLVNAVFSDIKSTNPDRNIKLIINAPNVEVKSDKVLLQSVIENLIGNAVKFTKNKEKAVIEFGIEKVDEKNHTVYFIKDNGAGFDKKYKEKLFKAFQRLHKTSEFEGTGIGLASVKRIINRLGGNVWADGEINKGAVFYFYLK